MATKTKAELQEENDNLQAQIEELREMMQTMMSTRDNDKAPVVVQQTRRKRNFIIKSLTSDWCVLQGNKTHVIKQQFDTIVVPEDELNLIIMNARNLFIDGCVELVPTQDAKDYMEENSLDYIFGTQHKGEEIIRDIIENGNVEAFTALDETQKRMVTKVIVDKAFRGEEFDILLGKVIKEQMNIDVFAIEKLPTDAEIAEAAKR